MRKRVKKADKKDISYEFIHLTVNMLNIKRKWSKQKSLWISTIGFINIGFNLNRLCENNHLIAQ
jgi:hypothetical protein